MKEGGEKWNDRGRRKKRGEDRERINTLRGQLHLGEGTLRCNSYSVSQSARPKRKKTRNRNEKK